MQKAQKRSAVREEVFWFRKKILPPEKDENHDATETEDEYGAMTINQIINGKVYFNLICCLFNRNIIICDIYIYIYLFEL